MARAKSTDDLLRQKRRLESALRDSGAQERLTRVRQAYSDYTDNIVRSRDGQSIRNDSAVRYKAKFVGYTRPETTRLASSARGAVAG